VNDQNKHEHEWVVFSTALQEGLLMLQCVECGAMGTVDDPTREEWAEAFHAPSRPYRWTEEARVHVRHEPPCPLYVVRAEKDAPVCDCDSHREAHEYERFPAEIVKPEKNLTPEEKMDLEELAQMVGTSDLCSRNFPFFIRSYQDSTGNEPTGVVKRIANRIEEIDRMGLHCSPEVVSKVLRMHAEGQNGTDR
jgi:hypothetical protein